MPTEGIIRIQIHHSHGKLITLTGIAKRVVLSAWGKHHVRANEIFIGCSLVHGFVIVHIAAELC